jgi:hypothetical protein
MSISRDEALVLLRNLRALGNDSGADAIARALGLPVVKAEGVVVGAPPEPSRSKWRKRRGFCDLDHAHDSQTEARVCIALRSEIEGRGLVLFVHARLPLLAIAPELSGIPAFLRIDFAVVAPGSPPRIVRLVDAKPRKHAAVSRDWHRGRLALQASYGVPVEERHE